MLAERRPHRLATAAPPHAWAAPAAAFAPVAGLRSSLRSASGAVRRPTPGGFHA